MTNPPEPGPSTPGQPEPAQLRLLRRLVTLLMAVMIVGFIVIVGLFVIRLTDRAPALPDKITLPDGTQPEAVTFGRGWIAVVSTDGRILIFDATTGELRQSIAIE